MHRTKKHLCSHTMRSPCYSKRKSQRIKRNHGHNFDKKTIIDVDFDSTHPFISKHIDISISKLKQIDDIAINKPRLKQSFHGKYKVYNVPVIHTNEFIDDEYADDENSDDENSDDIEKLVQETISYMFFLNTKYVPDGFGCERMTLKKKPLRKLTTKQYLAEEYF